MCLQAQALPPHPRWSWERHYHAWLQDFPFPLGSLPDQPFSSDGFALAVDVIIVFSVRIQSGFVFPPALEDEKQFFLLSLTHF